MLDKLSRVNATLQGSGDTVSRFVAKEDARVEHELIVLSDSEAAVLKATSPNLQRFRRAPIYRRWVGRSRLVASLPKRPR